MFGVSAEEARELILSGTAPDELKVLGTLDFRDYPTSLSLPKCLHVTGSLFLANCQSLYLPEVLYVGVWLDLGGCIGLIALPDNLQVERYLDLWGCVGLTSLPDNLQVEYLHLDGCVNLRSLPNNLQVKRQLYLDDCVRLTSLPDNLQVDEWLSLRGCVRLTSLPDNLRVSVLDLSGCVRLTSLPDNLQVGHLVLSGCVRLTSLPDDLQVDLLDLRDCEQLIQNTSLQYLEQFKLVWDQIVVIPPHVLKHPEWLTPQQILAESNVEVRRIMLERYGMSRFIENLGANPIHEDKYGMLYRCGLPNDEPLVMVRVKDASTDREYFLRVPPEMQTAHEAVAWTFGLSVDEYHPDIET